MNPEFQRNLWLEASPRRVTWAAVTVVLIYAPRRWSPATSSIRAAIFSGVGIAVFVACAVIWAAPGRGLLGADRGRRAHLGLPAAFGPDRLGHDLGQALRRDPAWPRPPALTGIVVHLLAAGPPRPLAGPACCWPRRCWCRALSFMAALVGVRKARAEGRVARTGGVLGGLILGYFLLSGLAASRALQH